jgi:hypothetical protein
VFWDISNNDSRNPEIHRKSTCASSGAQESTQSLTPHTQTQRAHTHAHTSAPEHESLFFLRPRRVRLKKAHAGASCIFDLIGRLESGVGSERGRERPRRLCSERAESRAEISSLNFRHKSASLESREVLFRRSRASPRVTETLRQIISTARHRRLAEGVGVRQRHNL